MQASEPTILVVDDDPTVLDVVADMLAPYGYEILKASTGEAALQLAQHHSGSIALLLADVVMPGLNGVEVAERLRGIRPETRVLFMSGFSTDFVVARGVQPGDPLLVKPFGVDVLVRKIREVLDYRSPFARRPEPPRR